MTTATQTAWAIDPSHSEVIFKVKHMMISTVTGHFNSYTANVKAIDDTFANAQIEVELDVNSITTKNEDRDGHLKSDDFFNAETYPKITFKSTSFDGSKLVGNLTIRDITKEVTLDVNVNGVAVDPYGQTKAGFEISGEINRKEFNLSWNAITEAGNIVVSDTVKLAIEAQFIKQA
jgi:polyisoprenoid-binding protein YceI